VLGYVCPTNKQNGCPAGSSMTRTWSCGLELSEHRARGARPRHAVVEILYCDVKVHHDLRRIGLRWPHGRHVVRFMLEGQAGSAVRRTQRHPVGLVRDSRPSEQPLVEGRERAGVGCTQDGRDESRSGLLRSTHLCILTDCISRDRCVAAIEKLRS
jgi:hypothetical protein